MAECDQKSTRQDMHRRAQRAEGRLEKLSAHVADLEGRWRYWATSYGKLKARKPLIPADLRGEYWVVRKPTWLRQQHQGGGRG